MCSDPYSQCSNLIKYLQTIDQIIVGLSIKHKKTIVQAKGIQTLLIGTFEYRHVSQQAKNVGDAKIILNQCIHWKSFINAYFENNFQTIFKRGWCGLLSLFVKKEETKTQIVFVFIDMMIFYKACFGFAETED